MLINPCRARGVPREPRSQEGLPDELLTGGRGVFVVPFPSQGAHGSFFKRPRDPSKIDPFWTLSKINKNGVAVRLVRLLAALDAPKSKNGPQHGPKSDILGPQTGHNATWCQSSSKHKLYYDSTDILLYLILNKL